MFGNPVPGYIHPKSWVRPAGNTDFRQSQTCSDHLARGAGCAQDISNQREGSPVLAMEAGKVTSRYIQNTPGKVGHGSLIMRVTGAGRLDGGGYWSQGYAHLQSFSVPLGTIVTRGQQIGIVGSTGAPGQPHLHCDVKHHTSAAPNGVAKDLWPLLDQNIIPPGGSDDVNIKGTWKANVTNKRATTVASARLRAEPSTAAVILGTYPAGTAVYPFAVVDGQAVNGSTEWFMACMDTADAAAAPDVIGYFHASTLTNWSAVESSGFTQDQLNAAVKAGKHSAATAVAAAADSAAGNFPA